MKKIYSVITRLMPVATACLTLILTISANSNSCVFMNEPKAPDALAQFKIIK